jgi:amino acid adenylation domain-containing protein
MTEIPRTLCTGFLKSSKVFPHKIALEVDGLRITYRALHDRAASIAATLLSSSQNEEPRLTAVFAQRSVIAFAGILGSLMRGHGYVPLNPAFPIERTKRMFQNSGCHSIIVDAASENQVDPLLQGIEDRMLIIFPEKEDVSSLRSRWPNHIILGLKDIESADEWSLPVVSPDSMAYILYTSGSTGIPKGVMISHRNMNHFIDAMMSRYAFSPEDRFSQFNDLTFDVSAFDMFVAWEAGGTVCCVPPRAVIQPGKFIQSAQLTLWYSSPSVAIRMKKMGMMKPNQYPNLKYSFFAGEALPWEVANSCQAAAPNSIVENLYGPTELTVTCTYYRYRPETTKEESAHGLVPIGEPHPGMKALIVNERLEEVEIGQEGELLMSGPQVALGYWRNLERTQEAFIIPSGKTEMFYRTGDRVRKDHENGPLHFLGRLDNQVKIYGYRVELGEIEAVLREEASTDAVVAIGWPLTSSGVGGIVAFIGDMEKDVPAIISRVRSRLPNYMVPSKIYLLPELPLNANRKVDRKALMLTLTG